MAENFKVTDLNDNINSSVIVPLGKSNVCFAKKDSKKLVRGDFFTAAIADREVTQIEVDLEKAE